MVEWVNGVGNGYGAVGIRQTGWVWRELDVHVDVVVAVVTVLILFTGDLFVS